MARVKPRVKVPKKAKPGEVVTIKTLISHPMESGLRRDRDTGELVPQKIINSFSATFEGEPVLAIDLERAVAANPYFEFQMRVPGAGMLRFEWVDDDGSIYRMERAIKAA